MTLRPLARPLVALGLLSLACNPIPADDATASGSTSSSSSGESTTAATTTTTTGTTDAETTTSTTGDVIPPTPGPLKAGVAVGHIGGPVGASMAGYGLRTVTNNTAWNDQLNGSAGFHGKPSIKAMVLEVDGERLVLLKIPTMSSEASLTEGTARKLEELHGIDLTGRIFTGATHSHHTQARYWRLPPQLGLVGADSPDEEMIDRLSTAFAETIKAAIDDLGPAEWAYGWQDEWDPDDLVYRDRRGENDPTYGKDARVTMLAVRRADGTPMAAILNFGMHGTIFDSDNELFTEDAPGGLEMKFEEEFFAATGEPILGMFIQSGGGDASPNGGFLGHNNPQKIEMLGHAAAGRLHDLYDGLQWKGDLALTVRSRRIDLRYETFGYDQVPEFQAPGGVPYTWGAWQCKGDVVDDGNPETSMEGKPKSCQDVETLLTLFGASIPNGEMHQVYLSAAILDDLALVTLPGEPTSSVIQYLRQSLGDRALDPMAFGYSQDHLLYLTHPDDWFQGGYETEMSLWGPFAAKTLVDRQMELVDDLVAGVQGPIFSEESPNLSPAQPFEPRAHERSLDAGAILEPAPGSVERVDAFLFRWGGGDPGVDTPRVVVERGEGGRFTPVPAPSGWAGFALDNSRYHMITTYAGDPKPKGEIAESRAHHWTVAWEVPIDFPAGTYRLTVTGQSWDGAALQPYTLHSEPFGVVASSTAAVDAHLEGGTLRFNVTAAPPTMENPKGGGNWLIRGYRVHDPTVGPDGPLRLRAPLAISFTVDGVDDDATYPVEFSPGDDAYVFDFGKTGLSGDEVKVRAHLSADAAPSWMSGIVGP
ncbi:MAG: hypothetical protein R3B09_15105 [Nannocystaceae bacterium]